MMRKVFIFGAGGTGQRVRELLENRYEIIGYVDNDSTKWGKELNGIRIFSPPVLKEGKYDYIVLGTLMGYEEIQK